jgi:hypothetical protein
MSNCIECGNKIGILGGYRHPVYGETKYVCGDCFTKLDGSMEKWREFVLSNSFNNDTPEINVNDIKVSFANINNDLRDIFASISTEKTNIY